MGLDISQINQCLEETLIISIIIMMACDPVFFFELKCQLEWNVFPIVGKQHIVLYEFSEWEQGSYF